MHGTRPTFDELCCVSDECLSKWIFCVLYLGPRAEDSIINQAEPGAMIQGAAQPQTVLDVSSGLPAGIEGYLPELKAARRNRKAAPLPTTSLLQKCP